MWECARWDRVRNAYVKKIAAIPPANDQLARTETKTKRVAFMREIGCEHCAVTIKTDQEEAMQAIVTEVSRVRAARGGDRLVAEASPKYQSKSNGVIERAVQTVEHQMEVAQSALEERLKTKLSVKSSVWPWLVEYVALLINRMEVSADGKTSYERNKGKRAKMLGYEFGEMVLWRRKPTSGRLAKLECVWEDGVYLGIKATTGEYIVGDKTGIWRPRTLHRKPFEERWTDQNLAMIGGVPWRTSDNDPKVDGKKLEVVKSPEGQCTQPQDKVTEIARETVPIGFKITKKDLEDVGYSKGCPGCFSILRGTSLLKHSSACRQRLERGLAHYDEVKSAGERIDAYLGRAIEADVEMRAKRRKLAEDKAAEAATDSASSEPWQESESFVVCVSIVRGRLAQEQRT